ncbi:hypothetical protein F751_6406 [Auxenochlorella protothecoides]|uniref:Uncharacterized protein n=1 Tax=Auxenochlorella protothecoides TaxID=3075 RepID=A0A087SAZ3_AUXPR|nr:hypothetical protein F751_6406 [Auxenochlorella protothecoides]KFM22897.1 hypothetical protein F751_6406 [Auxenochlorella protothecoides]
MAHAPGTAGRPTWYLSGSPAGATGGNLTRTNPLTSPPPCSGDKHSTTCPQGS